MEGMFATRGAFVLSGLDFTENTWTQRLVGSMKRHLPSHEVRYTADEALNFRNVQAKHSLLGNSMDIINCFLFQGSVDAQINKYIGMQVESESPQEDAPSSGDDGNIEVGKKADPLGEYPPKLGQLVAGIQISIVQKCARMFMNGKPIKEELKSSGLYLNKQAAPFAVKMTIPVCVQPTLFHPLSHVPK